MRPGCIFWLYFDFHGQLIRWGLYKYGYYITSSAQSVAELPGF